MLTRKQLLESGVRSLKESYPSVSSDNILTDRIYSAFFKGQLDDLLEEKTLPRQVLEVARKLRAEIKD